MPFWFWNDDLQDDEIKRQMADFRAHGVHGFVIHPRMGLPKSIPYLGERFLHHITVAVEEAQRTGMLVCLYDEAMYPSGSAHGEVVRSDPSLAAQGLMKLEEQVIGPKEVTLSPIHEGLLVATVIGPRVNNKLDYEKLRLIDSNSATLAIPSGNWLVMRFVQVPTHGRIRGVHAGEDDHEPEAPMAANLLNPKAVEAFIHFGYEPYAKAVGSHFGKTVVSMFTDEPDMLGRGATRGLVPWTPGLADYFRLHRGYDLLPKLAGLFDRRDERTQGLRADFEQTLSERLGETYYGRLSKWCADHKIALTGHPAASDDINHLHLFQIPGQDMVWRWLLPDNGSGLTGPNSTVGKCSSSVARHDARRWNSDEVYGAYGWRLTLEEMKWLADWFLVRGVTRLYPHAFYYSIRDQRGQERPPDLGPHNLWWPYYKLFADYTARLSGLLTDSQQVCDVAVLSVRNHLPWRAAKWLFEHQIDFNYLEDWRVLGDARIESKTLAVGPMRYAILIVDQDGPLSDKLTARLKAFESAGGRVIHWKDPAVTQPPVSSSDVSVEPAAPELRCMHVRKSGMDFYLLTNEGSAAIDTRLTCARGAAEWFDAWKGEFAPVAVLNTAPQRMTVAVNISRRESRVLCVDTTHPDVQVTEHAPRAGEVRRMPLTGSWSVTRDNGEQVTSELVDWRKLPNMQTFSGTLHYKTTFTIDEQTIADYSVDLGEVGDWAVVRLNGRSLGPRFWSPYAWKLSDLLRTGSNELVVDVTNSLANRYDPKEARPSGLLGPASLKTRSQ